jgi:hypothetical protein
MAATAASTTLSVSLTAAAVARALALLTLDPVKGHWLARFPGCG